MNFRAMAGLGVAAALLLIVYNALGVIVAGVVLAAQTLFVYVLVVGTLAGVFIGAMVWKQKETERLRPVDGQFPLQRQRLADGSTVWVDPNKSLSGIIRVDPHTGATEQMPAAGWELQERYVRAVQTTRSLAAITPGDNAMIRTHGAIRQPRLPASITKLLPGYGKEERTPAPVVAPVAALPAIPRTPATAQQMIASPGPQTTRLAIGEAVTDGEIVYWDMEQHPFARLHGATQSGKTSLARLLVAQAIRHGFEVVIVDRRRGKDWGIFSRHAELVDARETSVLVAAIDREIERYGDRDQQLGRYHAPNLAALANITGNAYRRRLIVFEELGTQTVNARTAGKSAYIAFVTGLRKLTAEAGATGIHGLYIDQIPDQWDKAVRYNASGSICFHLPDYGGQVAGYPSAHLLPQYHCHYDGHIVRAGQLSEEQIAQTIAKAPTVRSVPPIVQGGGSGVNTPPNTPTNTPRTPVPTNTAPSTPSEWQEFADRFFDGNPAASQRALTRAMAAAVNDGRPAEAFLGGLSSELFHRHSPRGAKYQRPTQ